MNIRYIKSKTIPESWFLLLREVVENGREYTIERGSYKGKRRKQLDFVVIYIEYPSSRPLLPDIPPHLGIPAPADETYLLNEYLPYLMCARKSENEEYTYGEFLEKQIEEVIRMYKEDGFNTNQAYMTVGNPECIYMEDPPCLRGIDIKIINEKLHFFVYFRSWDLWNGYPVNVASIQLLKEYMSESIGVSDGELVLMSAGLHLYDHVWDLALKRIGK